MNILLSGPFGLGSLCDEIVLGGVLKPLLAAKHEVTLLAADYDAAAAAHPDIEIIELPSPASLLSTPEAYKALGAAHFFGLCGAGVISDKGKHPARAWLGQLESARQMELVTGLIGAGAIDIDDRREQARVQRILHHFADGITVRDDASKEALIRVGLNANRVSVSGDPVLALFDVTVLRAAAATPVSAGDAAETPPTQKSRAAFFFTDGLPMRQTFAPDPTYAPGTLSRGLAALRRELHSSGIDALVFHDNSRQNQKLAQTIADAAPQSTTLLGPDKSIAELRAAMASCSVAITDTLHGLLFAAVNTVPAVYLCSEGGVPPIVQKIGLERFSLDAAGGTFDPTRALELMRQIQLEAQSLRPAMSAAVAILARKEAQNARMIERLVPKRLRYKAQDRVATRHWGEEEVARAPKKSARRT